MDINPLQSISGAVYTAQARVGSKASQSPLPVESFQSVSSNSTPGVNMKDALYLLFGGDSPMEKLWDMEPDGFKFSDRGNYEGPAPLMNSTSIFKGDQTSYRRINQVTGKPEWEFKLGKNEEFLNCKPVLTKDNLLGLMYQHYENPFTHEGGEPGLLVIDTKSGKEVFRTDGSDSLYDGLHTDGQGNLYCASVRKHEVCRISPAGDMTVLGEFGPTSDRFLCGMKVTSDGTVYYPYTNSNKMVRLKSGKERVSEVQGTIDDFHPLENGRVVVVSRYPSSITCLSKNGKAAWKMPVNEEFIKTSVTPDGKVFVLHHRRREKGDKNPEPSYIDCTGPDGKTAWTFPMNVPELNDVWSWLDCKLHVGPTGDLLVMHSSESKVICIGPDGKEKWHFAPPDWVSSGVHYSITKDEKMFVLHNGSMVKLDLATGEKELEYDRGDATLTRHRDGADPEVTKLNSNDTVHFRGIVLERDDHHIFTFDEQGRFCAIEFPTPGKEKDEDDGTIHAGSAADKVEVIDDYIMIDGVMLPINKNNSLV